jgi:hypothetical protein
VKYSLANSQILGCPGGTYDLEDAAWLQLDGLGAVSAIWRQRRGDALAVGRDVVQHGRRPAADDSWVHVVSWRMESQSWRLRRVG